jgi:hypothetical protein
VHPGLLWRKTSRTAAPLTAGQSQTKGTDHLQPAQQASLSSDTMLLLLLLLLQVIALLMPFCHKNLYAAAIQTACAAAATAAATATAAADSVAWVAKQGSKVLGFASLSAFKSAVASAAAGAASTAAAHLLLAGSSEGPCASVAAAALAPAPAQQITATAAVTVVVFG